MSQQALDLRATVQIVRRRRILVGVLTIVGLLVGGAYAVLNPPTLTSQALVVLPQSGGPNVQTQVVIAASDPVLDGALDRIGHGATLQTLRKEVKPSNLTSNVIAVSATASSAANAEDIANAVANSYVAYVGSATSPVGHVAARLLQAATTATGLTLVKKLIYDVLFGGLGGVVVGVIAALALSRGDRRLRTRDEIANSIGLPVLASLPVQRPSDAPGWTKLLNDYEPKIVHAWRLRMALEHLGVAASGQRNGSAASVAVLSLSADKGALALGPQMAAFAASQGIPTALVIGPQQDANVTAALRTACAQPLQGSERTRFLRVFAPEDLRGFGGTGAALVVVVSVVDSRAPQIAETIPTRTTLIGVSSGAATAEQLARAATVADTAGCPVTGILVADPDSEDQTTGRIPELGKPPHRMKPTRIKDIPTEIRR